MSKTIRFRNSGKLDLGGKNMEYILAGVLLLIIVAAVVLALGPIRCGKESVGPAGKPMVKCRECGKQWEVKREELRNYEREMEMGGTPIGTDCPYCKEEGCVFRMQQCPKCKEYYLSKRITDYEAFVEDGKKEICPKCGTDVYEWYKEHRRR